MFSKLLFTYLFLALPGMTLVMFVKLLGLRTRAAPFSLYCVSGCGSFTLISFLYSAICWSKVNISSPSSFVYFLLFFNCMLYLMLLLPYANSCPFEGDSCSTRIGCPLVLSKTFGTESKVSFIVASVSTDSFSCSFCDVVGILPKVSVLNYLPSGLDGLLHLLSILSMIASCWPISFIVWSFWFMMSVIWGESEQSG